MNFAYHSKKWKKRYDWQIVFLRRDHSHPILGHADHHADCPRLTPKFAPADGAPVRTRDRAAFTNWSQYHMLYPRSLHASNSAASPQHIRRQDYTESAWAVYVIERQSALVSYAAQEPDISASDLCGASIVEKWEACFREFSSVVQ